MGVNPRTAVITTVSGRHQHLRAQHRSLATGTVRPDHYVVVAMGDLDVAAVTSEQREVPADVAFLEADPHQLPLAAARNAGAGRAIAAGADLLIFLDVDCIASDRLVERYRSVAAASELAPTILSGTVRYLPPAPPTGYDTGFCQQYGKAHPARPDPEPTAIIDAADPNLFWSLSFALPSTVWRSLGGFCEDYLGYGGEDTDFAATATQRRTALWWLGGADAYHQYHLSRNPPVDHLDDIVRNANIFHRRWGRWPMQGWLDQFREADLAHQDDHNGWVVGPAASNANHSAQMPARTR